MIEAALATWASWTGAAWAFERHHCRLLARIPHRVLVWGFRGKTTAVRLLHASLLAAQRKALARETGDEPCVILPDGKREEARRYGPPNIREMRRVARHAARQSCEAIVLENMAIAPELALDVARHAVKPTVYMWTFDATDHGEVWPERAPDRAAMVARAIPPTMPVVVPDARRNAAVIEALRASRHQVLATQPLQVDGLRPHAASLAGAVWRVLEEMNAATGEAREALVSAAQELQHISVYKQENRLVVDLLSANDPDSVRDWIESLQREGKLEPAPALLFCHREDRPYRLAAFAPLLRQFPSVVAGARGTGRLLRKFGLQAARDPEEFLRARPQAILVGSTHGVGESLRAQLATGEVLRW